MKSTTVTFNFEKSTKGTHRYQEVETDGQPLAAGTLYLKKDFLKSVNQTEDAPAKIRITIELA